MCSDNPLTQSVFDLYRSRAFPMYKFVWADVKGYLTLDPDDFLCSGNLNEVTEISTLPAKHYILTRDKLIRTRIAGKLDELGTLNSLRNPRDEDSYYLCMLNPLLKRIKGAGRYGFSLTIGSHGHSFLCESKEDRQRWLEALLQVSVLEDLTYNYELGEVVGAGSSACVRIGRAKKTHLEYAVKTIPKAKLADQSHSLVRHQKTTAFGRGI